MKKYYSLSNPVPGEPENPSGNWGQGRRLEFIDFRLRWEKTVNRSDLMKHFGISIPQASMDIARYTQLAGDNLSYDKSLRTYRATDAYSPVVGNTSAQRFLNELLACDQGLLREQDSYLGWRPEMASVPRLSRLVESETLSLLLDSIRERGCVRILYQSDSVAEPVDRVISPHAFGFDGFRWHVRSFCFLRDAYRDFVLGRILKITREPGQGRTPEQDIKWSNIVLLSIGACPSLTDGNRKAVELDYSMKGGKVDIEVREALLYYVLKQLRLAPFSSTLASENQIVLLNEEEISSYMQGVLSADSGVRSKGSST